MAVAAAPESSESNDAIHGKFRLEWRAGSDSKEPVSAKSLIPVGTPIQSWRTAHLCFADLQHTPRAAHPRMLHIPVCSGVALDIYCQ